jgi:hypothetical protein
MASVNNIEDKFIKINKPKLRKNPKEINSFTKLIDNVCALNFVIVLLITPLLEASKISKVLNF